MPKKKWAGNVYVVFCNPEPEIYNAYTAERVAIERAKTLLKFRTDILDDLKIPYAVRELFTSPRRLMKNPESFEYHHKAVIYNKIIEIDPEFKQREKDDANLKCASWVDNCIIKVERLRVY